MALVTVIPGTFATPGLPTLGVLGFTDTFNRPDADTLGRTEGMPVLDWQIWASSEAEGRIRGGEAEFGRLAGGPCIAVVDGKTSDGTVEATLGKIDGSQSGIAFRASGSGDYWSLRNVGPRYRLYSVINSTATEVEASSVVTPAVGHKIRAVLSGDTITCYAEGVELFTHTSPEHADATHHGLYNSNSIGANSWRDVKVAAA